MESLSRSFGSRTVEPQEREQLIRRVFHSVAGRYDLMNDCMSFGIHRLWKRSLAWQVKRAPFTDLVDLAGGTGDIAALLAGEGRRVTVVDPSTAMMAVGRERRPEPAWLAGSAEAIPMKSGSADVVTISFGIRNVTHIDRALAEIHRVLRPGGRFFCLEFSRPAALIRPFYDLYSRLVIPRLGAAVAGEREAYTYLVESIRRFPDQRAMAELIEAAGFTGVAYRNLSFGIACIHSGTRS